MTHALRGTVLVTGGAGFIGSHLCDALLSAGHGVMAVDDLSTGRLENLAHAQSHPRFAFEELDVRDAEALAALARDRQAVAMFHLAANSDIRAGNAAPRRDLDQTLATTLAALEACVAAGVPDFLFASSSAIYGELPQGVAVAEDHGPLAPISFYGAAKLAAEGFISAYAHQHGLRSWVARFPNVVGDRSTHGVLFDFAAKLQANPTRLEVLGDGSQCKPYLLVDDLIDALLLAWRRLPGRHDIFHIGGGTTTTVATIAQLAVAQLAPGAAIAYTGGDRGWRGDVPRFRYDTRRLAALGWQPSRDSDAAVAEALARMARELQP